jgi:hypothetical protein
MPAPKINLKFEARTTFRKDFVRKVGKPPAPMDLTGYTVEGAILDDWEGSTLLPMTVGNGRIAVVALQGRVDMLLSAADLDVAWRFAVYNIKLTAPSGDVTRLARGYITVQPYAAP